MKKIKNRMHTRIKPQISALHMNSKRQDTTENWALLVHSLVHAEV